MRDKGVVQFLLVLAVTIGAEEVPKSMLKKVALNSLMESCWGKENVRQFHTRVRSAVEKCLNYQDNFVASADAPPAAILRKESDATSYNTFYDLWMEFLAFQEAQGRLKYSGGPIWPLMASRGQLRGRKAEFQEQGRPGSSRFRNMMKKQYSIRDVEEEGRNFREALFDFQSSSQEDVSNLTCVLVELGVVDSDLKINTAHFKYDMWRKLSGSVDPDLKTSLIEGCDDCLTLAGSIPTHLIEKKFPAVRSLGPQMVFLKCAMKSQLEACAKQEMVRWLQDTHQVELTPQLQDRLDLPADKFDAALTIVKVLKNTKSRAEKFVYDFILGGGHHNDN